MNSLFPSFSKGVLSLLLIIFLFLFVYSPRMMSFNTSHLLLLFAFPFSLFNFKRCKDVFVRSKLNNLVLFFLVAKLVSLFTASIYDIEPDYYGCFQLCFELPIIITSVMVFMKKHFYTSEDLLTFLIIIGIIQTLIGFLMIVFPSFKEIIDNQRHQFWDDRYIGLSSWRMFGLSDNLLHITPIVQALIAFFILLRSSNNLWMTLLLPLFFVLCALNTRTSAVVFFILLFLYFVFAKNVHHKGYVFICLLLIITFSFSSLLVFMSTNAEGGYEYLKIGFDGVLGFLNGDASASNVAFSSGYNALPNDLLLFLFGIGHEIQTGLKYNGQYFEGDMGFLNDVWRYGAIMSLLLWTGIMWQARLIKKAKIVNSRLITIAMIIVFLVSQYKGTTIVYCDYIVVLLLLSCSFVLDENRELINFKKNKRVDTYAKT